MATDLRLRLLPGLIGLMLPPAAAWVADEDILAGVLADARRGAREVDVRRKRADDHQTLACADATKADLDLQNSNDNRPETLALLASTARPKHDG